MRGHILMGLIFALTAALLLAACTPTAPTEQQVPPRPVAAIVALERPGVVSPPPLGPPETWDVWRVSLDGTSTRIDLHASLAHPVRLSPDGHTLLYAVASAPLVGHGPTTFHRRDLKSGEDTAVLTTNATESLRTFGWTAEGRVVAITSISRSFDPLHEVVKYATVITSPGPEERHAIPNVETSSSTALDVLAGSGRSLYLASQSQGTPNFNSFSLMRVDLESGHAETVFGLQEYALGRGPFEVFGTGWKRNDLPASALLEIGAPVERYYPVLSAISVRRITDGEEVRSLPVTPPADSPQYRNPVYDSSLKRYLMSAISGRSVAIWETQGTAGATKKLVAGTTEAPKPQPIGYVGSDVLYRVTVGGRNTLRLYERLKGTSRLLADVGPATVPDTPWYPAAKLVGLEYAR